MIRSPARDRCSRLDRFCRVRSRNLFGRRRCRPARSISPGAPRLGTTLGSHDGRSARGRRAARRGPSRRNGAPPSCAHRRDHPGPAPGRARSRHDSSDSPSLLITVTDARSRHRQRRPDRHRQFQGRSRASARRSSARGVREAVRRAGIDPALVDECIMGNVVSAGLGQNPARQAALHGGLPETSPHSPSIRSAAPG